MTAVATPTPRTVTIPTAVGVPHYTMRCRLDGKDYNFRMKWNERSQRWHMNIYADDETPLVLGIKLVANWPLIRYYQYNPDVPQGALIAVDLSNDGSPPGLYDFGEDLRVELTYFPVTSR